VIPASDAYLVSSPARDVRLSRSRCPVVDDSIVPPESRTSFDVAHFDKNLRNFVTFDRMRGWDVCLCATRLAPVVSGASDSDPLEPPGSADCCSS